jgi:hypothetical protein
VGGAGSPTVDPQLGPLQINGGSLTLQTPTMALGLNSPAIGAGSPGICTGPLVNNQDQRGFSRNASGRHGCDIGAYDTGGSIPISKGWNLIDGVLYNGSPTSATGLATSVNNQVGSNAVGAVATYGHGRFAVYVPGYSADQTLAAGQGVFVLSAKAGSWLPPGSPFTGSNEPQVQLDPGWNLVAAPYPYRGLDGVLIDGELGPAAPSGCGMQEVATYGSGSYAAFLHGATGSFHVAAPAGMWVECTQAYAWTPGSVV